MLEHDLKQRLDWKVGSTVSIHCDAKSVFVFGVINAINMHGGKELLSVRYCIEGGDEQIKVAERFGNDVKPYAHDIATFIAVNKNEVFEEKQTNEDACVKRVIFVSKVYTKWMMMSENTTARMEVDIRDVIESTLHPNYNL
eukprot:370180_1